MAGFSFTSAMISQLNTDETSVEQNLGQSGAGAQIYQDILDDISQIGITGFVGTEPVYGDVPAAGIPVDVWDWIDGAISVNKDNDFAGDFIVKYTIDQYNLRTGSDSYSTQDFFKASNQLAILVLEDIKTNNNFLLSLDQIGTDDAGAAAGKIFESIYNGVQDATGWAGTLLFPFLSDSKFFNNLLLSSGTIENNANGQNKINSGMYDLVAALEAQDEATYQAIGGNILTNPLSILEAELNPSYANIAGYQDILSQAIISANESFANYYNLNSDNEFMPGNDLVFNGVSSLFQKNIYVAGNCRRW